MKHASYRGKYQKKNTLRLPLSAYLTYLLVATLLFTGASLSKFATTTSGEDGARVAIAAADRTVTINNPLVAAPGESREITVEITNKEGLRVCEVAQEYTLYVENLSGNLGLTYEFVDAAATTYTDAAGDEHTAVTGNFAAGVEESVTYTIRVTWEGPQPDHMAFEMDALQIVVLASQVD